MQTNPPTAQIPPAAKARSKAPDVVEDPSLARLLFCEILLEEYEGLNQPALDDDEVKKIKIEIEQHWLKNEEQRALDEPEFEGRMVKRIYQAMNVAQSAQIQRTRSVLEDKYKDDDAENKKKAVDDGVLRARAR